MNLTIFNDIIELLDESEGFEYESNSKYVKELNNMKNAQKNLYKWEHFDELPFKIQDEIFEYVGYNKIAPGKYIGRHEGDCEYIDLNNHFYKYGMIDFRDDIEDVLKSPLKYTDLTVSDVEEYCYNETIGVPVGNSHAGYFSTIGKIRRREIENNENILLNNAKNIMIHSEGQSTALFSEDKRITTAVYECKACGHLEYVPADISGDLKYEYDKCSECGYVNVDFNDKLSTYSTYQTLIVKSFDKKQDILLLFKDISISKLVNFEDKIKFKGSFVLERIPNTYGIVVLCTDFNVIESDSVDVEPAETITPEEVDRKSQDYTAWRKSVLEKDNCKCVCCGETNKPEAHHLFGFKNYLSLRFDTDNGVVLCHWCHNKYHTLYDKRDANPSSFIRFLLAENNKE